MARGYAEDVEGEASGFDLENLFPAEALPE